MVEAQGGDAGVILDTDKFASARFSHEVRAQRSGYISFMDAEGTGIASSMLGAGRQTKESTIDYAAGIILKKKTGDKVEEGQVIAVMYSEHEEFFEAAEQRYTEAVRIEDERPQEQPLIYARVTKDGVTKK